MIETNRRSEIETQGAFPAAHTLNHLGKEEDAAFLPTGKLNSKELIKNAKLLLSSGDVKLAKQIFRALIESGETLGTAYSGLGACFELESREDLAIKAYREAIIYEPTYGTLLALSELYIKKLDYPSAIGTLLRANSIENISHIQSFEIHKLLGNCYLHIEQLNNAESHYRKAFEINALSDSLHVNIGSLALKKQDGATALLHFKEALRINSSNANAHTGCGLAYYTQGQKQLAHDSFCRALEFNIHDVSAVYNLVKCAYELKNFDLALEKLEKFIQSNAISSHVIFTHAGLFYHAQKFSEALRECDRLMQLSPGHEGAKKLQSLIRQRQNS